MTFSIHKRMWIIIAAYNEGKVIREVLGEIQSAGYRNIIVVDDGSADDTAAQARKVSGVKVFRHPLNRGKGAATKTGIEAAKILGADIIVTLDGDGQHNPKDIENLIRPIQEGAVDVVLGTRLLHPKGMPWYKIIANYIGNAFTWYFYGLWVSDSQSGFRAYSRKAADCIDTKTDRYEYDSEVIREIHTHKLSFTEVPIEVRYTEYSMGKVHKQNVVNGIKTLYKIIWSIIS